MISGKLMFLLIYAPYQEKVASTSEEDLKAKMEHVLANSDTSFNPRDPRK